MPAQTTPVAANLERVRTCIARASERSGRRADEITLVAVSKKVPIEAIRAAHEAGVRDFGENRVQEWESKQPRLEGLDGTWHLIGHLQSNKARRAVHIFNRVDSLDSLALAHKLNAAAVAEGKRLPVLIEARLGGEETKTGVAETDLPALAEAVEELPQLELLGLMAIPPYFDDAEFARPHFRQLRLLRDGLCEQLGRPFPVLSMGMSHDFEIAIEEGATEIRIGAALFGERDLAP